MDGLEIRLLKIHIPSGHFERGVAQDALEPKNIPAIPNVVHGKCVPEGVEAEPDAGDVEAVPQAFEIAQGVVIVQLGATPRGEYQSTASLLSPEPPPHQLSHLV